MRVTPPPPPRLPISAYESAAVLAVDDNPNNLSSLEALLGDLHANVVKAHSGDEALRHLLERDFAVILLDIQMPGLDGYETAKLIRSRARSRHIPIIFITAQSPTETSIVRGYTLGAVDFLFKPIIADVLRAKVSVFLDLTRKTRQAEKSAELLRGSEQREHERALAETRREVEHQHLRRVTEARELLSGVANELLVGVVDDEVLTRLYARVGQHLALAVIFEHRALTSHDHLSMASSIGLAQSELDARAVVELGRGLQGLVASTQERVIVADVGNTSYASCEAAHTAGLGAVACFPLVASGRPLPGTLTFATRTPRAFTADEIDVMQSFANLIGAALERRRLSNELNDRDRRKDEFLAMLSHEIRNPLATIRTAIELMRMPEVPPATAKRALVLADRQVAHLTRMLDDLLDVSRITEGKVVLRRSRVTLASIIEQAVETAEQLIKERGHVLDITLPEEPIALDVDATRLTQVVANLLVNAAKYTEPQGRISIVVEHQADVLTIRVSDNGVGIRAELLPRVFDAFVQADPSSDRAQGGLGIGLTLVHRLVELHGGTVTATSPGHGEGSEFTVSLPLPSTLFAERSAASPLADEGRSSMADIPPMHVLLVEDDDDVRGSMKDILERHGHRVDEAPDGHRGAEMLLQLLPDLALVDLGLPGLDGYGFAALVRASSGAAAHTTLVAVTGYGSPEEKERALKVGFDGHLVKPVSMNDLATLLKSLR